MGVMMLKGRGGENVYQFTWRAVAVPVRRAKLREVMVVECIVLIGGFVFGAIIWVNLY